MLAMFHEFVHPFHTKKHGEVVFAATYVGNYLWNLIRDKFDAEAAYGDIKFEKQAVDWENRFDGAVRNKDGLAENSGQNARREKKSSRLKDYADCGFLFLWKLAVAVLVNNDYVDVVASAGIPPYCRGDCLHRHFVGVVYAHALFVF